MFSTRSIALQSIRPHTAFTLPNKKKVGNAVARMVVYEAINR